MPIVVLQGRRRHSSLIFGLVVVCVGVVLLLDRMGIVEARDVFRFWPVVLILIGLVGIFRPSRPGSVAFSALIGLMGIVLLLMELQFIHVTFREIWPVFIIAAGLLMIWGALHPRPSRIRIGNSPNPSTSPHLNVTSIFADGNWTVTAQDFQSGYIRAVFGGFKVDLTQASMAADHASIDLDIVFAGGEIRIPDSWSVLMDAQPVFGACEDKTRRLQQPSTAKTLVLRGKVVFGGVEVRN